MTDTYKPGEAYELWIAGKIDHATFWEVIQRRSAAALGKTWEQYCIEMQPIEPIEPLPPFEIPPEIAAILSQD